MTPVVGVLAPTQSLARSLAAELNIRQPVCLSPQTLDQNSFALTVLLVESTCWPLSKRSALALRKNLGYILVVQRHDPKGLFDDPATTEPGRPSARLTGAPPVHLGGQPRR